MGIVMRHDPVATPMIAAYATGVGQAQERNKKMATDRLRELDARRHATAMEFQKNAWNVENRTATFKHQQDLQKNQQDFWIQRDEANNQAQADRAQQGQWSDFIRQGLHDGTFAYTPEQKSQFAQIQGDLAAIDADPSLTPEQKQQAKSQLEGKRQGILMNPQPKMWGEEPMPLQDDFAANTIMDGGERWGKNRYGEWQKLSEGPKASDGAAAANKLEDRRYKILDSQRSMRMELEGQRDPVTGKSIYTKQEIDERIEREFADDWEAFGRMERGSQSLGDQQQGKPGSGGDIRQGVKGENGPAAPATLAELEAQDARRNTQTKTDAQGAALPPTDQMRAAQEAQQQQQASAQAQPDIQQQAQQAQQQQQPSPEEQARSIAARAQDTLPPQQAEMVNEATAMIAKYGRDPSTWPPEEQQRWNQIIMSINNFRQNM